MRFFPVYFSDHFFSHQDIWNFEFVPKAYFFDFLRRDELTFLYPNTGMGLSLAANPHNIIFYPLNIFYLWMPAISAFKLIYFLAYPMTGAGWCLALRMLGFRIWTAGATSTLFLASGLMWSSHFRVEIYSTLWTGWALAAFLFAVEKRHALLALGSGIIAGFVFLGGSVPVACFTVAQLYWAGSVYPRALGLRAPPLKWVHRLFVWALFGFFLCCLPMIYQAAMIFPLSSRVLGFDANVALSYSSHPIRILDAWLPWLLPTPSAPDYPILSIHENQDLNWWYTSVAIGITGGILWILGWSQVKRGPWSLVLLAPLCAYFYLACTLYLPGGFDVWSHIPLLKYWRYPEKFLREIFLYQLPIFALGLRWIQERGDAYARNDRAPNPWRHIAYQTILALIPLGIVGEISSYLPAPETQSLSVFQKPPLALRPLLEGERGPSQSIRVLGCEYPPDMLRGWGLASFGGSDPTLPVVQKTITCGWPLAGAPLAWLGISHVLGPKHTPKDSHGEMSTHLSNLGLKVISPPEDQSLQLWESESSGPDKGVAASSGVTDPFIHDLLVGSKVKIARFDQSLERLKSGLIFIDPEHSLDSGGFDQKNTDFVGQALKELSSERAECRGRSWEHVPLHLNGTADVIKFERDGKCPAVVSLPWAYIPGWRAQVNNRPAVILRVNATTLGVVVPAGKSFATFRFEPPGFLISAAICWGLCAVFLSLGARHLILLYKRRDS